MSAVSSPLLADFPDSTRSVFRLLATGGASTRPALGEALSLSKPTMSAAIASLTDLGLVASQGSSKGVTGRSAVVYTIAPTAGFVLGVEIAATRVRVSAHSLDGAQISSRTVRPTLRRRTVTAAATASAIALVTEVLADVGPSGGPLREVVIAAPTLPSSADGDGLRLDGVQQLITGLPVPADVRVAVHNNVNCAAVAEHRLGVAQGQAAFVYLQIGVKIGAGIVINGQLLHGSHGAAGEIAMMPFPWAQGERPVRLGLEEYIGSDALMQRCARDWPARKGLPPADAEALFAAAGSGDTVARRFVDEHSRDIGRLVVMLVALIDPPLVVLGGGVGENRLVLPEVKRTVRELVRSTELTVGALGENATALGAVHIAIDRALDQIA